MEWVMAKDMAWATGWAMARWVDLDMDIAGSILGWGWDTDTKVVREEASGNSSVKWLRSARTEDLSLFLPKIR